MAQKKRGSFLKWILIGCGALALLAVGIIALLGWWLFSGPASGVKLGNEMDPYALECLAEHQLLDAGEEVLAYYDATMAMNGTEAAILTKQRILYHKRGRTTSFRLADARDVRHRNETLIGDVIEVEDSSGELLKIEIGPLNQGETFLNALRSAWRNSRGDPSDH